MQKIDHSINRRAVLRPEIYGVPEACLCRGYTVQKMAREKILYVFCTPRFLLRNAIAYVCNLSTKQKNVSIASVTQSVLVGRPKMQVTVEDIGIL
jgi:hypothetical protein